jgi:hypothetical protein
MKTIEYTVTDVLAEPDPVTPNQVYYHVHVEAEAYGRKSKHVLSFSSFRESMNVDEGYKFEA